MSKQKFIERMKGNELKCIEFMESESKTKPIAQLQNSLISDASLLEEMSLPQQTYLERIRSHDEQRRKSLAKKQIYKQTELREIQPECIEVILIEDSHQDGEIQSRQKKYIKKLREDEEKWNEFLEKERQRKQISRKRHRQMIVENPILLQEEREKNRQRMASYRKRKRESFQETRSFEIEMQINSIINKKEKKVKSVEEVSEC